MVSSECTKCGHNSAVVKDEPLQMLLAASMLVQRLKQVIGEWRASKVPIAKVMGAEIQDLLDEFAEDSKGSTGSGNSSIIQHKR